MTHTNTETSSGALKTRFLGICNSWIREITVVNVPAILARFATHLTSAS